jgi:hypothetical protein
LNKVKNIIIIPIVTILLVAVSNVIAFTEVNFIDHEVSVRSFSRAVLASECPDDISIYTEANECDAYISSGLNLNFSGGQLQKLTWELSGSTVGESATSGINQLSSYSFNAGTTEVTYSYTTVLNETGSCSFTVEIVDNEAPVVTAPEALTVNCDERIPSPHTTLQAFLNVGGTASDNCNLSANSFALANEVKDNTICPYTLTRTYQIADEHGNIGIVKQLIYVNEEGVISKSETGVSGDVVTISYTKSDVSCKGDNSGAINLAPSGTSGVVTYVWSTQNGDGIIQGREDQTNLTDGDYNVEIYENGAFLLDFEISILVADDEIPVIISPDTITLDCGKNIPAAFPTLAQFLSAGGFASDNCQINTSSFRLFSETQSSPICPYTVTRTYQIVDVN